MIISRQQADDYITNGSNNMPASLVATLVQAITTAAPCNVKYRKAVVHDKAARAVFFACRAVRRLEEKYCVDPSPEPTASKTALIRDVFQLCLDIVDGKVDIE